MLAFISLVASMPISDVFSNIPKLGGFTNIDITPGSEAFRISSYGIMNLREVCKHDNSISCNHIAHCTMYNVISAEKQLVNGINVNIIVNTTVGILDMNVHYSTENITISSLYKDVFLPTLHINVQTFETVAPLCTPNTDNITVISGTFLDGCESFLVMPVCANGIDYSNPCFAKIACRIDVTYGKCQNPKLI